MSVFFQWPFLTQCLSISLLINAIAFIIAYILQTDKLTDGTYAFTFFVLAIFSYGSVDSIHTSNVYRVVLMLMPILWALRLGLFLVRRVISKGKDSRFDNMRSVWWRFGSFWLLQALSIWLIAWPYILSLKYGSSSSVGEGLYGHPLFLIGFIVYFIGLSLETVADYQKSKFKSNPENNGIFISSGLYSVFRFPNYTGEILVWVGIFICCIPAIEGWMYISILSPAWIILLLTKISGIPLLEKAHQSKYGKLASFKDYKTSTKKLIPFIY